MKIFLLLLISRSLSVSRTHFSISIFFRTHDAHENVFDYTKTFSVDRIERERDIEHVQNELKRDSQLTLASWCDKDGNVREPERKREFEQKLSRDSCKHKIIFLVSDFMIHREKEMNFAIFEGHYDYAHNKLLTVFYLFSFTQLRSISTEI